MIAMVLSVSAVLATSFAGQLPSGEGVTADSAVEGGDRAAEAGTADPSGP